MRLIGASADDLNVLVAKGFVIPFESGVIVIKDWHVHNNLRDTHEAKSQFEDEYHRLMLSEQGNYQLQENYSSATVVLPLKIREVKLREDIHINVPVETGTTNSLWKKEYGEKYINAFNSLFNSKYILTKSREEKLKLRFRTYSGEQLSKALMNLSNSKFHRGDNDRGWTASPDFLIRSDEQVDIWLNKEK
jgi:hypothetical protein